ncbi:MAG: hypothetical protein QX189_08700 [Methylococcales bacterium]
MKLLDSNILIYSQQKEYAYLRSLIFDKECCASKITQIEVLGFHRLDDKAVRYQQTDKKAKQHHHDKPKAIKLDQSV